MPERCGLTMLLMFTARNYKVNMEQKHAACVERCLYEYIHRNSMLGGRLVHVQWNPEMRTLAGPTSRVLIIEVSFIQGLELFIITMSI